MRINKNGINSIIQSLNSRLIHVYIIWYECGITCMFILYECLWHHCKFDLTVTFWRTTFQWITLDIYEHNLNNEQKFFIPDFGSHASFKVFWFIAIGSKFRLLYSWCSNQNLVSIFRLYEYKPPRSCTLISSKKASYFIELE